MNWRVRVIVLDDACIAAAEGECFPFPSIECSGPLMDMYEIIRDLEEEINVWMCRFIPWSLAAKDN